MITGPLQGDRSRGKAQRGHPAVARRLPREQRRPLRVDATRRQRHLALDPHVRPRQRLTEPAGGRDLPVGHDTPIIVKTHHEAVAVGRHGRQQLVAIAFAVHEVDRAPGGA